MKKIIKKEAYLLPIYICLFFLPLFFLPIFSQSFTQGKEVFLKTVLLTSFFTILAAVLVRKKAKINDIFNGVLFYVFFVAFCLFFIANSFSSTPMVSFYGIQSRGFGMIIMLFLIGFGIYSALLLKKKTIIKSLKVLFSSGIIVAVYSLFQVFGVDPLFKNFDTDVFVGRTFAFLGNPGYLGQFLLIITLVGIYFIFEQKRIKYKVLILIPTVVVFFALLATRTRAAMLALVVCLGLLFLRYLKLIISKLINSKAWIKGIVATLIVVVLIVLGFVISKSPSDIFSTRSINSRVQIWQGAIELIEEKPLLGYGQETFYIYAPEIIDKEFLTLEEDISLSIDRIHNEFLDFMFSFGIFAGILYLVFIGVLFKIFFTEKDKLLMFISIILIGNIIQNQFGFPDITIALITSFLIASVFALKSKKRITMQIYGSLLTRSTLIIILLIVSGFVFIKTIYNPYMSEVLNAKSKDAYSISYEEVVHNHKAALSYMPYYSEPWYELMLIDPSSMERALFFLEQIEGESGNVLAWKGNFYSDDDPAKASQYYMKALEKNPFYPNWIRAYADMLYKNGDLENAYYLYLRYLEASPDFWMWGETVYDRSPEDQKSYRIFFKNVPAFWGTVERTNLLEEAKNQGVF